MDFALFSHIKSLLRGQRFDDLTELKQEVMNINFKMKTEQFEKIFCLPCGQIKVKTPGNSDGCPLESFETTSSFICGLFLSAINCPLLLTIDSDGK